MKPTIDSALSSDSVREGSTQEAVLKYGDLSTELIKPDMGKKPAESLTPSESRLAGAGGIVRTRFAPSPTGYLHVGGVRTALFAWLLAKQNKGDFILRLEDTDQTREIAGADEHLMECLKTLGLTYTEGPDIGGKYEPYRQSERLEIYKKWALGLIEKGRAYVDPYTPQEVQTFREQAQAEKKAFLYRHHRPEKPDTNWDGTKPLRFKSAPKAYDWSDAVMGRMHAGQEVVDDFIIMKSDGFPTYNFAHIVDDAEMKITHIIRGQEFLASTPNYLNLYEALDVTPPIIASVPPIMNEAGNKKLSKRDGAKDSLEYIKEGIPIPAFINFIASLGWNDGTEQEIFSIAELIEKFSLERVQNSGARFDERRLLWVSGSHIRSMDIDDLYEETTAFWPQSSAEDSEEYKKSILKLIQERLKFYGEIPELTSFFFQDLPVDESLISTNKQLGKIGREEIKSLLSTCREGLNTTEDWTAPAIQTRLNDLLETTGQKPGILFSLVRIATTQAPASPALADTLQLLGKERSLNRIDTQLDSLR